MGCTVKVRGKMKICAGCLFNSRGRCSHSGPCPKAVGEPKPKPKPEPVLRDCGKCNTTLIRTSKNFYMCPKCNGKLIP